MSLLNIQQRSDLGYAHFGIECLVAIDIFPNWPNSLPTAKLQMIGHALLSTNFNILQTHLPSWSCGRVLAS